MDVVELSDALPCPIQKTKSEKPLKHMRLLNLIRSISLLQVSRSPHVKLEQPETSEVRSLKLRSGYCYIIAYLPTNQSCYNKLQMLFQLQLFSM